jgi:hypothetical protein
MQSGFKSRKLVSSSKLVQETTDFSRKKEVDIRYISVPLKLYYVIFKLETKYIIHRSHFLTNSTYEVYMHM